MFSRSLQMSAHGSNFISINATQLSLNGAPWNYFGSTIYGGSVTSNSVPTSNTVSQARSLGLNLIRITDWLDKTADLNTGWYDETRWQRVDATIAACGSAGIKVELDLSTYRNFIENHFQSGTSGPRYNPYIYNWTPFMTWVANRVNTVSGLLYKNDSTIAVVAFAGEPLPPNGNDANNDIRPTSAQLTSFYQTVSQLWKQLSSSILCTNGGFLQLDWNSGIDWQTIFAIPTIDIATIHAYPNNDGSDKPDITTVIPNVGNYCYGTLHKPWLLEEYGYYQGIGDSVRSSKFQAMYDRMGTYHSAGIAYWNSGSESRSDTFDVGSQTPLTAATVLQNSPKP